MSVRQLSSTELTELVRACVKAGSTLSRIVFSSPRGDEGLILKAALQPVQIKGTLYFQATSYDRKKADVKNLGLEGALSFLGRLLDGSYRHINILQTDATLQVERFPNGKIALLTRKARGPREKPSLAHDREKCRPITVENSRDVLFELGMTTKAGGLKPTMMKKYRQVNEFIRIFAASSFFQACGNGPVEVVDFGCGNAYLTFSLFHYLSRICEKNVRLTGVDRNADSIQRNRKRAEALGFTDLHFVRDDISSFAASTAPSVILSLHACDTASDEAIARGISWNSPLILCSPCCHHHLNRQLRTGGNEVLVRPIMKYGMILDKMGDALTDAFRAQILSLMGYSVSALKLVDPENTERNLLLKAERSHGAPSREEMLQYSALRDFFGVVPYLETLLEAAVQSQGSCGPDWLNRRR